MKKLAIFWPVALSAMLLASSLAVFPKPVLASSTNTPDFTRGTTHSDTTLLEDSSGGVWGWGDNSQVGDSQQKVPYPKKISQLSGLSHVTTWGNASLGIDSAGSVWGWGTNGSNLLSSAASPFWNRAPVKIIGNAQVAEVSIGNQHALARLSDGSVRVWGQNHYGQFGNGTTDDLGSAPIVVQGLSNITRIVAGNKHSLAIDSSGQVWLWGEEKGVPTVAHKISGLNNIVDISIGRDHTLALDRDGNVWAWGDNKYNQMGDTQVFGTTVQTPVKVWSSGNIRNIYAKGDSSFALRTDGVLLGWGYNNKGQLGNGSTTNIVVPTPVPGMDNVKFLTTGTLSPTAEFRPVIAVKGDNTIWMWGHNKTAQGKSPLPESVQTETLNSIPVQIKPGSPELSQETPGDKANSVYVLAKITTPSDPTVSTLEYKIGDTGTWLGYIDKLDITQTSTVYARVIDALGFVSEESSLHVQLTSAPSPDPGPQPGATSYNIIPGINRMYGTYVFADKRDMVAKEDLMIGSFSKVSAAW